MTLASFLLVSLTHVVLTQAPPSPEPPPMTGPVSAPPLLSSPDTCSSATETRYAQGFDALVEGDDAEALAAFEQVLDVCPQHPYATEMARLARARMQPGARLASAAVSDLQRERTSGGARAALTIIQSLHGITQGVLLCAIADCEDNQGAAGAVLLGGAAGAVGSLLLTQGGITPGQSGAINSGTVWGFWLGICGYNALDLGDDEAPALVSGSAALFTGLGIALALAAPPTSGQVSMTNSGGMWAAVITALILGAQDIDNTSFFAAELGATSAGLLTFAILSRTVEVSRGRMLVIDGGGIVGGLSGAAFALLLSGQDTDSDAVLIASSVGAVAGLGLTAYLTRHFDGRRAPEVVFTPSLMGRDGAGLAMLGRF
ncbi:hypothetical protein LY474_34945 [Myxococcus stipitatus]|uniref:hypothetical protein n=1 Tax=Myxococcus stipitatus TaxID=83455 RepID=UPI001F43D5AB|nr:hypothetical protein [Myxococcus stipitatus]MCE9673017.1 hypothetical protein [Myxococcus stipitatus]